MTQVIEKESVYKLVWCTFISKEKEKESQLNGEKNN